MVDVEIKLILDNAIVGIKLISNENNNNNNKIKSKKCLTVRVWNADGTGYNRFKLLSLSITS